MIKFKFQSNVIRDVESLVSCEPVFNANILWIGVNTVVCPDSLVSDFKEALLNKNISLDGVGEAEFK